MTHLDQHQRAPQGGYQLQRKLLAATIAACFGVAQANPTLPQVVAGQATFSQQGNVFSITNTPNTIINWQSFSVQRDEITRFIQQSSDSKVLNRITGQDPSQILGSLQSNGQVFLINPNGIMFGKDARIDVNGLVASSLQLSNADFLAGKNNFNAEGHAGKVVNQGQITTPQGGKVFLIAPTVENHGVITAPNGEVLLAAGKSVQLVDSSNPAIQVVVSAPEDQALNLGQIVAQGGRVGIYGALVNQRGIVNADSAVRGENGKIILKASRTVLADAGSRTTATGAGKGGDIQILGEKVGLNGDAVVDASGQQGGGSVLLGGDYQGKNAAVQNAKQTFVGKNAVVKADALASGDGGKVIVWGDESAQAYGAISARSANGKGGFVETSGHYLDVAGLRVDTTGKDTNGVWLLDPYNIEIVSSSGGYGLADMADFNGGAGGTATSSINASDINGAGTNVVLLAKNDINVNAAVNITTANVGLTAQAGNNINVNQAITTNGGAVTLSAGDIASGTANAAGTVYVNQGITTAGGNVVLKGPRIDVAAAVNSSAGDITATTQPGGTINILASGSLRAAPASITDPQPTIALTADNLDIAGSITNSDNGGGFVSIATRTVGREININAADTTSASSMSLTNDELAHIDAYELALGNANGGTININSELNTSGKSMHLSFQSNNDINVNALVRADTLHTIYMGTTGSGKLNVVSGGSVRAGDVYLRSDDLRLGGAAGTIAGNTVYLDLESSTAALKVGSDPSAQVTTAELKTLSATNIKIGSAAGYLGTTSVEGTLDLSTQTGLSRVTLEGGAVAINGAVTVPAELELKSSGAVSGSAAVTADKLYVTGASVDLGGLNDVNKLVGSASTTFAFKDVDGIQLDSGNGLEGVNADSITLTASSLTQTFSAPLVANELTLLGGGNYTLSGVANQVSKLTANGISSLDYTGSTSLTLESLTMPSTVTASHINVNLSGSATLTAKQVDAKTNAVTLAAPTVTVPAGGQVLGGGVIVNTSALNMSGTLTASTVSLLSSDDIYVGDTFSAVEGSALRLTSATLGKIDAQAIYVSAGYGDDLTVGTVTLPSFTSLYTQGILDISGTVTASKGLAMAAANYDLTGASIAAGSYAVNFSTSRSNGLMQVNGTQDSTTTYLNSAMLDAVSGEVLVGGANGVTVAGAVDRGARNIVLVSNSGSIDINAPVTAAGVTLQANSMNVNAAINATNKVNIAPLTDGVTKYSMVIGADCSTSNCLSFKDLSFINAPKVQFGMSYNTSTIDIAGIGGTGDTASNAAITQITLDASGNIAQTGAIGVSTLNILTPGTVTLNNAANAVSNVLLGTSTAKAQGVDFKTTTGLNLFNAYVTDTLKLTVGGSLTSTGAIVADKLQVQADGAVGTSSLALSTKVNYLDVVTNGSTGNSINIVNNSSSAPQALQVDQLVVGSGDGSITLSNYGATTIAGPVTTSSGNINVAAHSPLTVSGNVQSTTGNITLEAGASGSSSDKLTINSSVTTGGTVLLKAGDAILGNGTVTGSTVTRTPNLNPSSPPPVSPPPVSPPPVSPPPVNPPPVNPPPVNPPPVNPPPVNPPPVNPPPVNPPPVNPPPVNPPPVDPPPVNPPPVNPPPVDPPPVNPPPVNPPPTADICTIAPNSALCQVLSPPTASEPEKPVQAATKEVIKTITREGSGSGSGSSSGGGSSSGKGSDSSGGPAATDKDEQKKAEKETATTEKQGTQNEKPPAKTYCN
ncbi:two-partner secretion domain-containing protein [Massilia endophytica]|uniref:two-partner secretion domain-containing protein n=1 Tax=Massilia endophytica TaxID=2899220 RepID=UPI001E5137CB|nr:filamentous hemagglutinin N-terminal domain-containing protein [Massilia endophytica]UGQ45006.1 filamentous hemagglutinin N-terminal domain-containing protein [Massilia endophytica]